MSEDEFEAFVRAQWPQLRATVGRIAQRFGLEAEDALQEALLRAHAYRDRFESERHAANWICRVAHDLLCDQRRSWYGRRVSASAELPEWGLGAAPDPAEVVVRRESGQRVLRALAELPAAQRLLLWQHAVDGRSYADIARDTARPLGTVRSVALRARVAARQRLAPEHGAVPPVGTGLLVRLRTGWAQIHAHGIPADGLAAVIVLVLGFGGLGAGVAGAAVPVTQTAGHAIARATSPTATAGFRGAPYRRPAPHRVVAPKPTRSPAPEPFPFEYATFSGDRWGACTFGETGRPGFIASKVPEGSYRCDVAAESASCSIVPVGASTAAGCSVTIRGFAAGHTAWNGNPGPVDTCDSDGGGRGEVTVRVEGGETYVMPALLDVENAQLHVNAGLVRGDRWLTVGTTIPFVCSERVDRAPLLTGRLTVYPWTD